MVWRAALSESALGDLETLVEAGRLGGTRRVTSGRWLQPIPLILGFDGMPQELDFEPAALARRTPSALTTAALYTLAQHAPQARAVALVTGSRLTAERLDVIEVWVEHRDGVALTVLWPLRGQGRRMRVAEPRAFTGSRLVWASEPH